MYISEAEITDKMVNYLRTRDDWVLREEILAIINRTLMRMSDDYNDQLSWNVYKRIKSRINVGCIFEAGPTDMKPDAPLRGEYVRWYSMTQAEIDKIKMGLDAFDAL